MVRELTPNRWNWSQKDGKWVYIELTDTGEKNYYYDIDPPKEFWDLAFKIKSLNDKSLSWITLNFRFILANLSWSASSILITVLI